MNQEDAGRLHAMDALRASSMFLLVPVHAAILLAVNGHGGSWSTSVYWIIHLFRLPLFFSMSGFFLVLLLSKKGLEGTVRNRTVRIVGPLAIGIVTLVPLLLLASRATGVSISADGSIPSGSPFTFEPSYLWFLWYLLLIDLLAISAFLLAPGLLRAAGRAMHAALARPLMGFALLAIPTALLLLAAPTWMVSPGGNTFVPEIPALAYYAIYFGLGATLSANRGLIEQASQNAWGWLACAIAATVPAGLLYSLHNSAQFGQRPAVHFAAMLAYAIASWASLMALIGLASRYLTRPRPRLRYLAESSYWIYLSHLPAMVLCLDLVGVWSLGTGPTFVLAIVLTLGLSLLTYPLFVRYTAIGRLLNGGRSRSPRPAVAPSSTQPAAAAARRA